jgi:hypothetical protein
MTIDNRLLPVPVTGEALDLAADDETLIEAVDRIRDLERQLKEARDIVAHELIVRMDSRAKWTITAGHWKATAPSPAPKVEWDTERLRETLAGLVIDGTIATEAAESALERVVTLKPRVAGINALRKLGGDIQERIDACSTPAPAGERRLTVKAAR